jgi:P27 family predicted phage terminase small subunit
VSAGRPPLPTAVKELRGNPGRRPLNSREPKLPKLAGVPAPPATLREGPGRDKWVELAEILHRAGVLTSGDLHNLEAFCAAYARWRRAEEEIEAGGITLRTAHGVIKHPAVAVAADALKLLHMFGASLGLDPSSRSRLAVEAEKPENRFLAAVKGGKS